jgi:hypothetical protein
MDDLSLSGDCQCFYVALPWSDNLNTRFLRPKCLTMLLRESSPVIPEKLSLGLLVCFEFTPHCSALFRSEFESMFPRIYTMR